MVTRILLPTDGSEGAQRAVDEALRVAKAFDATVHALYVANTGFPEGDAEGRWLPWDAAVEYLSEEAQAFLTRVDERGDGERVDVRTEVRQGEPIHEVILEAAEDHDVDLIAMGTHGRSGLDRWLLGSVTEKVLRTSPVPVLAVPIRRSEEDMQEAEAEGPARQDAALDEAMGNEPDDASATHEAKDPGEGGDVDRREIESPSEH